MTYEDSPMRSKIKYFTETYISTAIKERLSSDKAGN